ncbi:MAG TPA: DUF2079 domain-containing protein [Thermoplasmata archaeon]|nr:DUF2079 domain-containing protein [Thermoplasmata archaeon]
MTAAAGPPTPPLPASILHTVWRGLTTQVGAFSRQIWVLLFVAVVYVEALSALEYVRYLAFNANAWDLGIFQQAFWSTATQGRLFYYTAELPWNSSGSLLGVHFSPILFLFVPAYFVFPGPLTLFVVQSSAVAASAFPLFGLARRRVGDWLAVLIAVLYLGSPPMLGAQFFDFHVESLIPATALTLWYAWETRRLRLAVASAALLLTTIEYAPILLGAIALQFGLRRLWLHRRRSARTEPGWRRQAVRPLAVTAAALPLALVWFMLPKLFSPATPPSFQVGPLGGSLSAILWNLFTHPSVVGAAFGILPLHKLRYLLGELWNGLFAWPLGILDALPAIPWFLVALLTAEPGYSGIVGYQYEFLTMPFLFLGTASGIGVARRGLRALWTRRQPRALGPGSEDAGPRRGMTRWFASGASRSRMRSVVVGVALVAISASSQIVYSPFVSTSATWLGIGSPPTAHDAVIRSFLDMIPASANVSAQPNIFPAVADRVNSYPYYEPGTRFLLVDVTNFWFTSPLPPPDPPMVWQRELARNVTTPYGLAASSDGVLLFEANYSGLPQRFTPYSVSAAPDRFDLENATYVRSSLAPFGSYLEPTANATRGMIWFGPYVMVPPGSYLLSIWLQRGSANPASIELLTWIDAGSTIVSTLVERSAQLGANWTAVQQLIVVPHAGQIELVARGLGQPADLRFGGFGMAELDTPVSIG